MTSDGTSDHNNCMEECNRRSDCGGFSLQAVQESIICLLRSEDCGNKVRLSSDGIVYTKQGKIHLTYHCTSASCKN